MDNPYETGTVSGGLFTELKKIGYDAVEIPVFEGETKHFRQMAGAISRAGLECSVVSCLGRDENPASEGARTRDAALSKLKWVMDIAVILGARLVVGPYFAKGVTSATPNADEMFLHTKKQRRKQGCSLFDGKTLAGWRGQRVTGAFRTLLSPPKTSPTNQSREKHFSHLG